MLVTYFAKNEMLKLKMASLRLETNILYGIDLAYNLTMLPTWP